MKKCLVVTALLLTPLTISAYFSDVLPGHPNYEAINYVQREGIVNGYPDGTYHPDSVINRAELTKIVIEANFTGTAVYYCDPYSIYSYSDASKNSWYSKYLCLATQHKIVSGYSDGTFRPDNTITFVEAAKIIAETSLFKRGIKQYDRQLPPGNGGPWYSAYVEYLKQKNAMPTTIDRLDKKITRGEVAEIIYRLSQADSVVREYPPAENQAGRELQITADGVDSSNAQNNQASYDLPYYAWNDDGETFYMQRNTHGDCYGGVCYEDNILYDFKTPDSHSHNPHWKTDHEGWLKSPDGTKAIQIVTSQYEDKVSTPLGTVSIKDLQTGRVRTLGKCTYQTGYQNAYTHACYDWPHWSPDSNFIAMHDVEHWGDIVVLKKDAGSISEVKLVGNSKLLEAGGIKPPFIIWAPDSRKLLGLHDYVIMDIYNGTLYRDTNENPWQKYGNWRWSPDSNFILLIQNYGQEKNPEERIYDIYTMQPNGSTPDTIYTYKGTYSEFPSADWSPDGRHVAVTDGNSLFVVNLRTRQKTILSRAGDNYSDVRWSPNGSRILYVRDGNIWVYEMPSQYHVPSGFVSAQEAAVFDSCGPPSRYQYENWYSKFLSDINSKIKTPHKINEMCYSKSDNLVIATTTLAECSGGSVIKYFILKGNIEAAGED